MSAHNIRFHCEIRQVLSGYPLLPAAMCTEKYMGKKAVFPLNIWTYLTPKNMQTRYTLFVTILTIFSEL